VREESSASGEENLSSEALAAFGTTTVNDGAPTTGGHAGTESMIARAADTAGLIGETHSKLLLRKGRKKGGAP